MKKLFVILGLVFLTSSSPTEDVLVGRVDLVEIGGSPFLRIYSYDSRFDQTNVAEIVAWNLSNHLETQDSEEKIIRGD